ncbi:MAG: molybdopterin converting factor subunit 1 [Alphaproteobacteria bacterium]|nr:molybdopterin converting factor subunit 1 [Alphaproteobacteria bacterium]HPF47575.1 molybdopterin converting factor subunit 1 [Emcibacteraceae bacterium]HRW29655.1 molybdopterin converting factor subunit 1 [Emcibacteraceae bacterium]
MNIFYFARIRENIGISSEEINLPSGVKTVSDLIRFLEDKGDNYSAAFAESDLIRVAVNNDYVGLDYKITDKDEIAIFPPMTGG